MFNASSILNTISCSPVETAQCSWQPGIDRNCESESDTSFRVCSIVTAQVVFQVELLVRKPVVNLKML